jgi:hypothetical protein
MFIEDARRPMESWSSFISFGMICALIGFACMTLVGIIW